MDIGRKLAEGIAGWLQFEHSCHRAPVFSEKYLSVPIAQILNTAYGPKVHAEVRHPILASLAKGPGRRPEIDFAVLDPFPHVLVAIESKWIGASISDTTVENILWDLIRLAILGNNASTKAFFILAGRKRNLDSLFSYPKFNGPADRKGRTRPILKVRKTDFMNFRLDAPTAHRANLLREVFKSCQDVEIPRRLGTSRAFVSPRECTSSQYQVFVWEVMPNPLSEVFKPRNHSHYGIPKAILTPELS